MTGQTHSPKAGIGQLAPQWIVAIAALITALAAAGFFAGRATAPSDTAATPQRTDGLAIQSTAATPPTSAPPVSTAGGNVANYSITMPIDRGVSLGDKAPVQSDFSEDRQASDLYFSHGYGEGEIFQGGTKANQIFALTGSAAPTYAACKSSTVFANSVKAVAGTTFCIVVANRMVGVTVGRITPGGGLLSGVPATIQVSVVIWDDRA